MESQLGRVSWGFSERVCEVVVNVSEYLGIHPPSRRQITDVSKGKVSHVALLVHPRLMAIGINEASRRGNWNKELDRSRSDLGHSQSDVGESWEDEMIQIGVVEDDSERARARAEIPAVSQELGLSTGSHRESSDRVVVVDCHWHPGRLPDPFTGDLDVFATLDTRPMAVPIILAGGCAVYGMDEPHEMPKRISERQWVIAKGIHPKEAERASKGDVQAIVDLCRNNCWAIGEIG
jgi:hypothetical protein